MRYDKTRDARIADMEMFTILLGSLKGSRVAHASTTAAPQRDSPQSVSGT